MKWYDEARKTRNILTVTNRCVALVHDIILQIDMIFRGRVHSKIEAIFFYPVMGVNSWPTGIKKKKKERKQWTEIFKANPIIWNWHSLRKCRQSPVPLCSRSHTVPTKKERIIINVLYWPSEAFIPAIGPQAGLQEIFRPFKNQQWFSNTGVDNA